MSYLKKYGPFVIGVAVISLGASWLINRYFPSVKQQING